MENRRECRKISEYSFGNVRIKKREVVEKAIIQLAKQTSREETLNEMKDKLDEMMNEIKIIRMYHILDTLKRSDYKAILKKCTFPYIEIR